MTENLPKIVDLTLESREISDHPIARINDHVIRISVMTQPFYWHFHPESDETFLVIEGHLNIEFDNGSLELGPNQVVTVPRGIHHRTSPVGDRVTYLIFAPAKAETRRIENLSQ